MKRSAADADRLRMWLEGERAVDGATDLLVEAGGNADAVQRLLLGTGAVVFVPDSLAVTGVFDDATRVVRYDGALELTGGEVSLADDVIIQTESYATAPYVSITVPTAFAINDEVDLDALRADMSAATSSGIMPAYLTAPAVTVVDQRDWLAPLLGGGDEVRRLLLRADGQLANGPGAALLPWSGRPEADSAAVLADAGELARFLGAAKVTRALQARLHEQVSVVGFDGSSSTGTARRTDTVFVASAAGSHYVIDIATNRLNRVPEMVGALVEEYLNARASDDGAAVTTELLAKTDPVLAALGLDRFAPAASRRPL